MRQNDCNIFFIGEQFNGYKIEKNLGCGGFSVVYLVRHEMLDTYYALKVLYPKVVAENPDFARRFLREAKIASRIRHPNLVAVYDCGFDQQRGIYYLVMDYVSGVNLREAIGLSGKFSCEEAVNVVMQVACALDAAQVYSVVHRDIKPENIMIEDDGGIKLVDLGVAKASGIKDSLKTAAECVFGTPAYVSPEQALSAHDVDVRADIYSLGIVFFEMITGRRPYEGKDAPTILREVISDSPTPYARDFNSEVPENVAVLVRRMCVKSRDRRICSTKELISELMKLGFENVAPVYPSERNVASLAVVNKKDAFLNQELSEAPVNFDNTLSFETEDVEIQRFVSKLKHKRLLKKKLKILAIGISVVLLVLIIVLLKYV